jgi:competence protein ComEC
MLATIATVVCFAYILGLFSTVIPGVIAGIPAGAIVMLLAGVIAAFLIRRVWRMAPRAWVWLAAGLVGMAAVLYFQIRLPQPEATDICHLAAGTGSQPFCQPATQATDTIQVSGIVGSAPRLTRSSRLQFELAATQIVPSPATQQTPQTVTGTLYVTVPPTAGEQLYPGLPVRVEGVLYQPKPATNPGGFDFAKSLAQQGIFAGLSGTRIEYPATEKPAPSLFWSIRQRIVQAQKFGLGEPEGALLSAMVLGKNAVDVPYPIQDQFKQTGLAHALAASGTQVSLLVGIILVLTRRLPNAARLILGVAILVLYIGLTGVEASVLRAGVMGSVVLLALVADRKVKPLGSLLFAATVLLLINPQWLFDLGFQLSFLATLGLLVTAPILTKWLDWMPSLFSSIVAVPIAAYLWTLPLSLYMFGVVSPYSILVNIIVSPLITIISICGMVSAAAALIHPFIGSHASWLLYYPTHWLIKIAEAGSQLPGSGFAVGTINPLQLAVLYGLMVLVWRWQKLYRYWWLAGIIGISFVAVPVVYAVNTVSEITLLSTTEKPVMLVRDQGKVGLIHSGSAKDAEFTVLPLLQKWGINQLDWAIAPSLEATEIAGWQVIANAKPIRIFYNSPRFDSPTGLRQNRATDAPAQSYEMLLRQIKRQQGIALPLTQPVRLGAATAESIAARPEIWRFHLHEQTWLWLEGVPALRRQTDLAGRLAAVDVMVWSGKALSPLLLEKLQPKTAVGFGKSLDSATEQWLRQHQVALYRLQAGAVQWRQGKLVEVGAEE